MKYDAGKSRNGIKMKYWIFEWRISKVTEYNGISRIRRVGSDIYLINPKEKGWNVAKKVWVRLPVICFVALDFPP